MTNRKMEKASAYGEVIAKAWRDPAFKAKLLADPQARYAKQGAASPAGVMVKVLENTDMHFHVVLPAKPSGVLSDEELDRAAGGVPCMSPVPWQPATMITYRDW